MVVLTGLMSAGCRQQDIREVVVETPGVFNAACADRVMQALGPLPGVDSGKTEIDFEARRVTVTYDSMRVAHKNIEMALTDAGFEANELKPTPAAVAKLPDACREATD